MLLGVSLPQTSYSLIAAILILTNISLAFIYLNKQKCEYKLISIAFLLYSILSSVYAIWYPGWHHIIGIAPIYILFFISMLYAWLEKRISSKSTFNHSAFVLFISLAFVFLPASIKFYKESHTYNQVFKNHTIYQWDFKAASFLTTADPELFRESSQLINKYVFDQKGIFLISKYDHILPLLADKYNLLPYIELPMHLVSFKEVDFVATSILNAKPKHIFIDSDIARDKMNDLPLKLDPVSVSLNLYESAKGRALVMNNLTEVFNILKQNYFECEHGKLISVYCLNNN